MVRRNRKNANFMCHLLLQRLWYPSTPYSKACMSIGPYQHLHPPPSLSHPNAAHDFSCGWVVLVVIFGHVASSAFLAMDKSPVFLDEETCRHIFRRDILTASLATVNVREEAVGSAFEHLANAIVVFVLGRVGAFKDNVSLMSKCVFVLVLPPLLQHITGSLHVALRLPGRVPVGQEISSIASDSFGKNVAYLMTVIFRNRRSLNCLCRVARLADAHSSGLVGSTFLACLLLGLTCSRHCYVVWLW
jgi:hypothetical protein